MDFDPDAFLSGGATPQAAPAFDPDAFLKSEGAAAPSKSSFNPNAFLDGNTSAEDRLKALSPIVSSPDASPEDDAAYLKAHQDYYTEHSAPQRAWTFLKDSPGAIAKAVPAIWNMGKELVGWTKQVGSPVTEDQLAADQFKAIGKGAAAGAGGALLGATNLLSGGAAQLAELFADVKDDPSYRQKAAQLSLGQLKLNGQVAPKLANPYDAQKQPLLNAAYSGAQFTAPAAIPGAGEVAGAATKAIGAVGDGIEYLGNQIVGRGMQAAAKVGPSVVNTAKVGGTVAAGVAHPALLAGAVLGMKPNAFFTKLGSLSSGMFQAVGDVGGEVAATPIGKSAFDQIALNADNLAEETNQANYVARAAKDRAARAYDIAYDQGLPTGKYAKALKQAEAAVQQADTASTIVQTGAKMAKWIQDKGMAGIPSKTADAISGAIMGSLYGGIVATGDPSADKAKPIAYGTILGLLGSAALSAKKNGPPGPPGSAAQAVSPGAPVGPSSLRATATAKATNTFEIPWADGTSVDLGKFTEALGHGSRELVNTVQKENPNAKFDIAKIMPREPVDPTNPDSNVMANPAVIPDDETIMNAVAAHKPMDSTTVKSMGYLPKEQVMSVRHQKTPGKYNHYIFTEVPPDVHQEFLNGTGTDGSVGRYFNKNIRTNYPYFEVKDRLFESAPPNEPRQ